MSLPIESDCCPICQEAEKQKGHLGHDLLWDAIPFYELLEEAAIRAKQCAFHSEGEIRRCAEELVTSRICECCRSEKTVVDAIVEEFVSKLMDAVESK